MKVMKILQIGLLATTLAGTTAYANTYRHHHRVYYTQTVRVAPGIRVRETHRVHHGLIGAIQRAHRRHVRIHNRVMRHLGL